MQNLMALNKGIDAGEFITCIDDREVVIKAAVKRGRKYQLARSFNTEYTSVAIIDDNNEEKSLLASRFEYEEPELIRKYKKNTNWGSF